MSELTEELARVIYPEAYGLDAYDIVDDVPVAQAEARLYASRAAAWLVEHPGQNLYQYIAWHAGTGVADADFLRRVCICKYQPGAGGGDRIRHELCRLCGGNFPLWHQWCR